MLAELTEVRKQYGDFFMNCTMCLEEGRVTGLIGKNGAGKSTAFKALLGLIHIDGGTVRVMGQNGVPLNVQQKGQIGVALSDSTFSGYLTVKQVIHIMEKMYPGFERERFIAECHKTAVPLDKKIKEFSTGTRAKLKVLLALSYGARMLILDEPTAGLDVVAREQILDLLREYMEQEGRGILISSHISSDLEGLCDDVYLIHEGKILLHEDMDVILDSYGLLKMNPDSFGKLDKSYILRTVKEAWGYSCLTNEKQFYVENYPELVVEKGSVDETVSMISKGEDL